jgi:hypothetical protein
LAKATNLQKMLVNYPPLICIYKVNKKCHNMALIQIEIRKTVEFFLNFKVIIILQELVFIKINSIKTIVLIVM